MDKQSKKEDSLVEGKYSFRDLVDLDRLRSIFEGFTKVTGLAIGVTSYPEQETLIATGWRDICTKFHRANPGSAQACLKSNIALTEKLKNIGDLGIEICDNGLVDGAISVIIKGKHVATIIAGQVFFEKPDMEVFKKRAETYGYDRDAYLKAVVETPVVSEKDFKEQLSFLGDIALLVAEQGYEGLEMREKSSLLQDIAAQRGKAEARVLHLNAVLRSISRINQLIIQEKNKEVILDSACRIIAECRDYRLVWIGSVSPDDFDILPVTEAGFETDYLRSISIKWDDSPAGNGPAGIAVKTRKPVIVEDIATDPAYVPWRDAALKSGYASMISVPIGRDSRIYGVMNVYSGQTNAFDEEEVDLLNELAGDIGVALHAIDIESERHRFEEALEREKALLDTTINSLPVFIYFKDTESRFVIANRTTAEAMGVKDPRDLIGKTDKDFYPHELAEMFLADEREVFRTGKPLENKEESIVTASGQVRWLLTSKTPVRDRSGAVIGLVGAGRDITESKQAAEALEQEKVFGDTIIDSIPGLFYVVDREGRYLRWSETQKDLFGFTDEQMWHLDVFSTIHEDDRDLLARKMKEVFVVGYTEGEGRVLTRRGVRYFYFSARRMIVGNEAYIVGTGIDFTDRKQAEEALVVSEESYRAIFNTANDAIFVHDIETGRIIDTNDKACEMYFYQKEEMLRLSVEDISIGEAPYTQADALAYINKAAQGEPQLFEWVSKDKMQRVFWTEVSLKRAVIGGKYRILAIVRDITERKRTEERWVKIHQIFLDFVPDPNENINRLTKLCGEILGADYALFNKFEEGRLHSCGQWNTPPDFVATDEAEGHICYDVTQGEHDEVVVIRDLRDTDYAKTDPIVSKFGLHTYVGKAIKISGEYIGTLCAVYQLDFNPTDEDKEIMSFIALAIGVEEERRAVEETNQIAQFAIEHSTDSIFWIGPDGRVLRVNEMACSSLGYPRDELLRMHAGDINPDYTRGAWLSHWQELKEKKSLNFETNLLRKDGSIFPVEMTANFLEFRGDEYNFVFARDITVRKKQEEDLYRRDYQLEILSRTSQHINAVLEVQIILRTLIAAAIELVDATAGMAGLSTGDMISFKEYNKDGKSSPIDYEVRFTDGTCGYMLKAPKTYICNDAATDKNVIPGAREKFGIRNFIDVPILNREGHLLGCLEIHNKRDGQPFDAQDVFMLQGLVAGAAVALENANSLAQRDKAEKALVWQKNYYETLIDDANVWMEAIDKQGRVLLWNKKAEAVSGRKKTEIIGGLQRWTFLYPDPVLRAKTMRFVKKVIAAGRTVKDMETEIVTASGQTKTISWSSNAIRDDRGTIIGAMFIGADVTERKRAERERAALDKEIVKTNTRLKQLALKDSQTGLYNHHYLGEVIEPEFYRAKRYGHPLSLVMIDIDYFKSVNDLYGHEFGDLVLKQFAQYLKRMVRKYDVVIRYGGEEFIVLSPGADRSKAIALGQRLLEAINLYDFGNKKHVIKLKLSMAAASFPDDMITKGMDLVDLCDKILNKVKESGGNAVYSSLDLKKGKAASSEHADVNFLKEKIARLTRRGKQSLIESIFAFAKTLEIRDQYTGKHVESTVFYSTEIAEALNMGREEMDQIKQAAVLHDLGKVGVSDKILHKRSALTAKEYEEIKKHPQIAADIIRPIQFMHDIIPLILYHHERWDGKGYPAGLKSEEIPIGARIISIADVYQALTSDRPYRKAYSKKEAMKIIRDGAGTQFDPAIVKAFLEILKKENGLPLS